MISSARSVALSALHRWAKTGDLVSETLRRSSGALSSEDRRLAFELCSGTIRRYWTIEWYASCLAAKRLPNTAIRKLLVLMALYQRLYHTSLPPHALVFEYVELAKQIGDKPFSAFVNGMLRTSLRTPLLVPQGATPEELSIQYSYPPFFIRRLLSTYGDGETVRLLEAQNIRLPTFRRKPFDSNRFQFSYDEPSSNEEPLTEQNPTQPTIFAALSQRLQPPQRVLDLCAGGGGKTMMAWEIFHPTTLIAHDPSSYRLQRAAEAAVREKAPVEIRVGDGLRLSEHESFDLVMVDPPCSNSGVLYKCPEARHRLREKDLNAHLRLQRSLLEKAHRLLAPHGTLFYTTCSILPEENEQMVQAACSELSLRLNGEPILILPDGEKHEGGFGAALHR